MNLDHCPHCGFQSTKTGYASHNCTFDTWVSVVSFYNSVIEYVSLIDQSIDDFKNTYIFEWEVNEGIMFFCKGYDAISETKCESETLYLQTFEKFKSMIAFL